MFNVDDNLKVVVHPEVESDYLKQYNNKSLYIPENAFFRPDINNLRYHQTHILDYTPHIYERHVFDVKMMNLFEHRTSR